jgi:mono/diheme cytochrome c family protein
MVLTATGILTVWLWGATVPASVGAAATSDGRRLYLEYCASCHGRRGVGDGPDAAIFAAPPRSLHEGFLKQYPTDDLVRRVREGKPLELGLDLPALRARAAEVEALVDYVKRLPTVDWALVDRGDEVYVERCEECHGAFGHPGKQLPPGVKAPRDLSDPVYQASVSDRNLQELVRHGRKEMPALVPRVTREETRQLAAFVRLLSPGHQLYTQYCAACHGDNGRGPGSLAEGIRRPTVKFDRNFLIATDPEELRAGVWHMVGEEKPSMPHYRTVLTEAQAAAILEYLKGSE